MPDFMDDDLVVDWPTLATDPVRREHQRPWLTRMKEEAVQHGLLDDAPGTAYWRGQHDALKMVLEQPEREVLEANRLAEKQAENKKKEEEHARRAKFGGAILRRLDPGWWNPGRRDRERVS